MRTERAARAVLRSGCVIAENENTGGICFRARYSALLLTLCRLSVTTFYVSLSLLLMLMLLLERRRDWGRRKPPCLKSKKKNLFDLFSRERVNGNNSCDFQIHGAYVSPIASRVDSNLF